VLPAAPKELVCELSKRYVYLYEKITGEQFQVGGRKRQGRRKQRIHRP
jgi:hypothetical protein